MQRVRYSPCAVACSLVVAVRDHSANGQNSGRVADVRPRHPHTLIAPLTLHSPFGKQQGARLVCHGGLDRPGRLLLVARRAHRADGALGFCVRTCWELTRSLGFCVRTCCELTRSLGLRVGTRVHGLGWCSGCASGCPGKKHIARVARGPLSGETVSCSPLRPPRRPRPRPASRRASRPSSRPPRTTPRSRRCATASRPRSARSSTRSVRWSASLRCTRVASSCAHLPFAQTTPSTPSRRRSTSSTTCALAFCVAKNHPLTRSLAHPLAAAVPLQVSARAPLAASRRAASGPTADDGRGLV